MESTLEQFIKDQGMDYDVLKNPSFQSFIDSNGVNGFREVPGQYNLVRSTDQVVVSPRTVSGTYRTITPRTMAESIEPFVSEGWIVPVKGFVFSEGTCEAMTFAVNEGQLDDGGKINGESWKHYVTFLNYHGSGDATKGILHSIRQPYGNRSMQLSRMANFRIRHTRGNEERFDLAVKTWKQLKDEIYQISERMKNWSNVAVTLDEAKRIMLNIYEIKDLDKASARTINEFDFAMSQFNNPKLGTYGKTIVDIYNAITATNSHYVTKNSKETADKKMASFLAGSRSKLETRAVNILEEMVEI